MPGMYPFTGRAGDAMLMDLSTWHTSLPNTCGKDREGLILQFGPFWRESGLTSMGKSLESAGRLGKEPSMLRQLLGLEYAAGGNYYDAEWMAANPRADLR